MALRRIDDADRLNKGVSGLSDTPNMEASALQAKFDELGNMAIDAYNETVDVLNSTDGALNIGATVPEGLNASDNTQSILNALARRTAHTDDLMHSHDNKDVLDTITQATKTGYDNLVDTLGGVTGVLQTVTDSTTDIPTGHAIVNYVGRMGGGDMQMVTYDANNDGIVDDSAALEGHPASYFATAEALDGKLDGEGLVTDYDQVAEGGSDTDVPSTSLIHTLISNFRDGVDRIYNKLVSNGSTPASESLDDVVAAIDDIRADGDAISADLAGGKTAWAGKTKITGTMKSKDAATYTPGTATQTIAAGQYLSGIQTIEGDSNLIAGNIKSGVTIFGVEGNSNVVNTSTGDATAAQILSGKKAYVKGALVTGNIPSKGTTTYTPTTSNQTIASGQYLSGTQTIKGDSNLTSGNIRSGVSIFGVSGNSNVVNTSDANASAGYILSGYSGYVKGSKINGSMTNRGAVNQTIAPGGSYTIPAGYHNGSGKVTASNKSLKIDYIGKYVSNSSSAAKTFNVATYVAKGCTINNFAMRNVKHVNDYPGNINNYYGSGDLTMALYGNTLSVPAYKDANYDGDMDVRNAHVEADIYVYYIE